MIPAMKEHARRIVRVLAPPLVRNRPIDTWPGWLGRTLGVKVPQALVPKAECDPRGGANINILCALLDRTQSLDGDIADCGVYRGETTLGMALHLRRKGIAKSIYGFDSFEGFDREVLAEDLTRGGAENEDREAHGFSLTSIQSVQEKLKRFHLSNVFLVKGYFEKSLPDFALSHEPPRLQFSFVHLDVNLYESYKQCMEFFYPRMVASGIILLDEYNDPPWPGCNKAVDELLAGLPEILEMIERDNYQKWYFVKRRCH